MSEASRKIPETHPQPPFALELIDLNAHPDGPLMRMIAEATVLRDRCDIAGIDIHRVTGGGTDSHALFRLTCAIVKLPALTPDGLKMKALFAIGDEADMGKFSVAVAPAMSVIQDMLRLGIPA